MEPIAIQAAAYAKATTNTRCLRMGECDICQIRYCDYRSRLEAFTAGYTQAAYCEKTKPNNPTTLNK